MADEDKEVTPSQNKGSRLDIHRIRFGGFEYSIPTIAFGLMLVGILLPTAKFSLGLNDPSPTQLLIAICISLFSAVVFLWILDATSLLRFRSEWVSKSIYGAAIASVLGTSVAVYKEAFSERKYPYEGRWELQIRDGERLIANNQVIMMYSDSAETYWGYSNFRAGQTQSKSLATWVQVNDFDSQSGKVNLSYFDKDGNEDVVAMTLKPMRSGKLFRGEQSVRSDNQDETTMVVTFGRPK